MVWGSNSHIVQEAGLLRCCKVWLAYPLPKFRRNEPPSQVSESFLGWSRYLSSKPPEACTVHNHTAQQPASSVWEQGRSEWNIPALCHTSTSSGNFATLLAIFIVAVFVLFISLHIKSPRKVALIIVILNTFQGTLWITFHSLPLSFSLIHTSSKVGSEYSATVGF
jgi:hypothetical protein